MLDAGMTPIRGRAPLGGASRVATPTAVAMGQEVMAGQLEKQAALARGTARTLQQLNAKASFVCAAWRYVDLLDECADNIATGGRIEAGSGCLVWRQYSHC